MALATLSIDLVAKLASFEQDLGKAARASQKTADDIGAAFGTIKNLASTLFAGVSVAGLANLTREVINSLEALEDLSRATGASVENISALEDIALRSGGSFETVATSLVKFNQALNAAKPGSDAEAAFNALNLSIQELQALDPAEALLQTALALQGFADDGNKARLVQELFGKSLREVAPLLNDIAEKGRLVATVTAEQSAQAKRFNDQLADLRKSFADTQRSLVADLLPTLVRLTQEFSSARNEGLGLGSISGALKTTFETVAVLAANVSFVLAGIGREIGAIAAQAAALGRLDWKGFSAISEAVKADGVRARAELDALEKRILGVKSGLAETGAGAGRGFVNPTLPRPSLPAIGSAGSAAGGARTAAGGSTRTPAEEIDDNRRALAAYVNSLEAELARTQELSSEQKTLNMLKEIGTLGQVPQVRELVLTLARQVDAIKAQTAATKAQEVADKEAAAAAEAAQRQAAAAVERARETSARYLESLNQEQQGLADNNLRLREHLEEIGLTKGAVEQLRLARLDATIALQEQTLATMDSTTSGEAEIEAMRRKIELLRQQRALMGATGIVQAAVDTRAEQDRAAKEFADTLHADLKNAFSAAFRDSGGDPLQAFGDALANVIFTRAATALADALATAVLEGGGGGGGGLIGWALDLFGFAGGGYTGSAPRSGGLDGQGGFLAMLHPQEQVLDLTRGQGSGTVNIQQTIHIDSRSDQASILAAMMQAKEMAKAEILRSRRSGGVFA